MFSTAAILVIWPVFVSAASIVAAETPKVEQLSGLPIFNHGGPLCTNAVTVCARALQPLSVAIGGTVTVRIADHHKSVYECRMINGVPTWLPTSVEGSCEAQPVIMLPAKYDASEAWNVG
ncbi:MAG: hypothetical protein WBK91_06215 [Alphaproteobacteria bacterium]